MSLVPNSLQNPLFKLFSFYYFPLRQIYYIEGSYKMVRLAVLVVCWLTRLLFIYFLSALYFFSVWMDCLGWLGISSTLQIECRSHFNELVYMVTLLILLFIYLFCSIYVTSSLLLLPHILCSLEPPALTKLSSFSFLQNFGDSRDGPQNCIFNYSIIF